jgi:hypothetical protein
LESTPSYSECISVSPEDMILVEYGHICSLL